MTLQSTAIHDRRVYAQDSAPSDERDGVIWVDTSSADNDLYTYDADSASWVLAAPENITISDTAPSSANLGDGWIDTSEDPPQFRVWDGGAWSYPSPHEETHRKAKASGTTFTFDTAFSLAPVINHSRYSAGSNNDYGNQFVYTYSTTGCEIRSYGDSSTQGEVGIHAIEEGL